MIASHGKFADPAGDMERGFSLVLLYDLLGAGSELPVGQGRGVGCNCQALAKLALRRSFSISS